MTDIPQPSLRLRTEQGTVRPDARDILRQALQAIDPADEVQPAQLVARMLEEAKARLAVKPRPLNFSLRHEVARLIVWRVVRTRPVVPSAVSYADGREGNTPYRACGHGTHSHPTGT